MRYYREPSGDYIGVDRRLTDCGAPNYFEGRATLTPGDITNVVTIPVKENYLKVCKRTRRDCVPKKWLKALKEKKVCM